VTVDPAHLAGKDYAAIARDLLGRDASQQTQPAIEKGLAGKEPTPPFIASLVLSSPEFQRR
jgi:hypothetical protein